MRKPHQKTTSQRGYGYDHKAIRRAYQASHHPSDPCSRCGKPLGDNWALIELDHRDDRTGYLGLSHQHCNRRAGAHKLNAQQRRERHYPTTPPTSYHTTSW